MELTNPGHPRDPRQNFEPCHFLDLHQRLIYGLTLPTSLTPKLDLHCLQNHVSRTTDALNPFKTEAVIR